MAELTPSPLATGDELPVDAARAAIAAALKPITATETLPVEAAVARVLATDVVSPIDVPAHDNSAMDGYALHGDDLVDGGPTTLAALPDTVYAGAPFTGITPQGLLRALGPHDELQHRDELGTWWADAVDAAVLSEHEYGVIDDRAALRDVALAITRGERGCIGQRGNVLVDLPGIGVHAVTPESTIGAGDVFAAAYFIALASGSAFADALDHANRTAAAHVGAET